jgi:hypothetical protein
MARKKKQDQVDINQSTDSGEDDGQGQGTPVLVLKLAPSRNFPEEIREFLKSPVKITLEPENRAWLEENNDHLPQLIARAKTLELLPVSEGGPLADQANQKFNYKISQFRLRLDHGRLEQKLRTPYNSESQLNPEPKDVAPGLDTTPQNKPSLLYANLLPAAERRPFFYLASIVDVTVQMEYKLVLEKEQQLTLEKTNEQRGTEFSPEPRLVPAGAVDEDNC